ncbi:serine/threonine-protein kinase [Nonomuraea sp. NPDC046570]|uniref:serine/threonine-protein kinase n=1 Tax=Nonomuraea sp. NPDC046570 TaxID=3155255 RepID=UPI0033D45CAA
MEPTGTAPLRPRDAREIGPYRLLGRLGEGGMGTVFLAASPAGRSVAVKVVKAEFANQPGFAARFHAEVDNARRVASFCTAQVLDNGNGADGRPYMVTEYIPGTPLSEQIIRYGALEPAALHGVALGVAAALAAIHVAGLVHRDLKPANVILSLSGPRVIDFGIARALDRESNFTLSGELLGSPGWWAPEQVRGQRVTPAADIFAWGCLVAYAGNGRHPFGRGDAITMATRVLNAPPDLGALPAPLNDLVRRATSMDPLQRPTAQDLLIALVGGALPEPTLVTPTEPPTLAATELLNDTELLKEWVPPPNLVPAAPPERPKPRGRRWLLAAAVAAVALLVTIGVLVLASPKGQLPQATSKPTAPTDVGRRFDLGEFDGPQFVITGRPSCGLSDVNGARPAAGRFCLVRWSLVNPGGQQRAVGISAVTLADDRDGRHELSAASTELPATLPAGTRLDGVFVFDLEPQRLPAHLELVQGATTIEVRL